MFFYRSAVINCVILTVIESTSAKGVNISSNDSKTVRRRNVMPYLTEPIQYMFNGTVCVVNNRWIDCPVIPAFTMMEHISKLSPAARDGVLWHLYQHAHHRDTFRPHPDQYNNKILGSLYPQNRRMMNSNIGNSLNFGLPQKPPSSPRLSQPLSRPGENSNRNTFNNSIVHKKNYVSRKKANSDKFSYYSTSTFITETQDAVQGSAVTPSTSIRRAEGSVSGSGSGEAPETSGMMTTLSSTLTPSTASTQFSPPPEFTTETRLDPAIMDNFFTSFDQFQRKLYEITFSKLAAIGPAARRENGISFVQSGVLLYLLLLALAPELDAASQAEICRGLGLQIPNADKARLISEVISLLPVPNEDLKFRWSSRLVLHEQPVSQRFQEMAPDLHLQVNRLNGTETPEELAKALNRMVEVDSAGSMHDTFEEEELSSVVRAVLLSTVCVRAGWRAAPTLLNGTRPFRDPAAPGRTARMIRINDIMRYADLNEWDAEALEIAYSTPGLKLVLVVPRGLSLRPLTARAATTGLPRLLSKMRPLRAAVTLPLYTLRMTLLLPNKFQAMNISRLVEVSENKSETEGLRLSHAVQRLMFWAEAGRNAFKDDGIEWDTPPEMELVVDRPYIFFVRYHNITLLSGNFVL